MKSVVKIESLFYKYKNTQALEDISLEIPLGATVGVIGPDGVGKSTLLALIAGVKKIQEGSLEVFEGDISLESFRQNVRSRVAYMPQGLGKNLYMSLSIYENLLFFARLFGLSKEQREKRIELLLKVTGLYEFQNRSVGKLSGGMKQKLGLCCALIHDPELLILDEPTTGVDPLSRREFWELIDKIKGVQKNMSVIVATAYMQEAQLFDYTIAMDEGKILSFTTPKELLSKTDSKDIDAAFIALLPEVKRLKHNGLQEIQKSIQKDEAIAIEARHLTMKFGDFIAVDDVSFSIKQGEIFGFLGSNGCGKTTTMKMLTGLLEPSAGEVDLFGKTIKENSLQMRKDVGYMTQSFSLYNELSILQNLRLHAELYGVASGQKEQRVEEVLERFSLKQYSTSLAGDLPLGIKQRLSLAVAVIHKPKMLILDEPTSGVDPISRDGFWQLLLDLAHNDGVTIFISTHFMNEGERCDRISLMHQGKVLASDTPDVLIASKQKENLEEAFIEYLSEAIEKKESHKGEIFALEKTSVQIQEGFLLTRFGGYAIRESLELLRDPVRLVFALLGMVILMFVMGYGISMDVEDLKFSVLDNDKSPQSREYVEFISGSRYFLEQEELQSYAQMEELMRRGEISIAIEIPPDFGRDIHKGLDVEVGAWIDGTMSFRAETIHGYLLGLHTSYLQSKLYGEAPVLVDIQMRYRYNQDFKSLYAIVPAVIPMLLIFIPSILMALSVVREKELGSITNFYATPVTRLEFMLGKQLPYVVISMVSFFGLLLLAVFVFGVPIKGDLLLLTFGAFLYVFATTGLGFLMSVFTKTQIAALGGTAIATLLPTVSFSGMQDPVSSLDGVAYFIGNIFPATYFINISRGIFSKDIGFSGHSFDLFALFLAALCIAALSLLTLKKQEQ
ncbi:MAG: ribosome-associated ATPase/putative transporter RbbA [Helicobacteraceae bacterium]|nr:ribosome-associated ATPase/putative transporter RbbA [Helicobacteraceae bacterium]